jgi:hypothetical protein
VAVAAKINSEQPIWYRRQIWNAGYHKGPYDFEPHTHEPLDVPIFEDRPEPQDDWEPRLLASDRLALQIKSHVPTKLAIRQLFTATIRLLSIYWRGLSQQQKADTWNEAAYAHASERPGRGDNQGNGWTHMAETEFAAVFHNIPAARTDFLDFHGMTDNADITAFNEEDQEVTFRVHWHADWPPTVDDFIFVYQVYPGCADLPSSMVDTLIVDCVSPAPGASGWTTFTATLPHDQEPGTEIKLLIRHHRGVEGVTNHVRTFEVPA